MDYGYPSSAHSMLLGDVQRSLAHSYPDALAVVDGHVRLTTSEFESRVNRLADALHGSGVGYGDRIMWLGQNSFRVLELIVAAGRIGGIFVPINWRQSPDELAFVLEDLQPRIVVWQHAEIGDVVHDLRQRNLDDALWLQHDAVESGPDSYEGFLRRGLDVDLKMEVNDGAAVLAVYTAAFSGRPSAALLSHRGIFVEDLVIGRYQELDHKSVFLNSGPLFHIGTLMIMMATWHHAGTNVFIPRVDPESICESIDREQVTHAFIPEPTFASLKAFPRRKDYDLSTLFGEFDSYEWRHMMVCPPGSSWFVHGGGYGQTEVGGVVSLRSLGRSPQGEHGRSSPVAHLSILGDADEELPTGQVGEIGVRGPTVMVGYFNRPDENRRRSMHGWHHTGDLGRREPDGSITFIGPAAKMIKSAGENIYPAEVENCLKGHPAVREVCVLGVPDDDWTQLVKALVVLEPGISTTPEDLIAYCRASIASYKKPRVIEFVRELPKVGGLVDRDAADAQYGGGGYPGGAYWTSEVGQSQ